MTINSASRSGVIWICGFSAAGKTTVSRKVLRLLNRSQVSAILLDGDELRGIYGNRWGYERDARLELGFVNHRLAAYLASQGHTVVIAAGGMYRQVHDWVKDNVPGAISVYLKVSEDERLRRDRETKKVYSQLNNISSLFDEIEPDLVVENFGAVTSDIAAETIVDFYLQKSSDRFKSARRAFWENHHKLDNSSEQSSLAPVARSQIREGSRLIDIGCGSGADIEALAPKMSLLVGLDPAASAIAKAQSRFLATGQKVTLVHGYVDKLAHYNASADVVLCRNVLDAVTRSEEREILAAAAQVLADKGEIFIECLSINDPSLRSGQIIGPSERLTDRYTRYVDIQSLADNLTAAGFAIENLDYEDASVGGQARKVIRGRGRKSH